MFQKALDLYIEEACARHKQAMLLMEAGRIHLLSALDKAGPGARPPRSMIQKASMMYQDAVALDPLLEGAWNGLGDCRFLMGDRQGARESWKRALAVNPNNRYARTSLGRLGR